MKPQPILQVDGLTRDFVMSKNLFGKPTHKLRAVNDVSFSIMPGETLGLVGESGSGKSTTGRLVLRLDDPTEGQVRFEGQEITHLKGPALRPVRKKLQVVFQDPYS